MRFTSTFIAVALLVASPTAFAQNTTKMIPAPADVAAPPSTAAKTGTGLASRVLKPGTGSAVPVTSTTTPACRRTTWPGGCVITSACR